MTCAAVQAAVPPVRSLHDVKRLGLLVVVQDALLGGRVVGVGEHTLFVQPCELVQLRYPRGLVICGRGRRRGGGG